MTFYKKNKLIKNNDKQQIGYESIYYPKSALISSKYFNPRFDNGVDGANFIFYKSFFKLKIYSFRRINKFFKKKIYKNFIRIEKKLNWKTRIHYFPITFNNKKSFFFWKTPSKKINKRSFNKLPFFSKFIKIRNNRIPTLTNNNSKVDDFGKLIIKKYKRKKIINKFNFYSKGFITRFNKYYTFSRSNFFFSPIKNQPFVFYRTHDNVIKYVKSNINRDFDNNKASFDKNINKIFKNFIFMKIIEIFNKYFKYLKFSNRKKISYKKYSIIWYKYNNFIKLSNKYRISKYRLLNKIKPARFFTFFRSKKYYVKKVNKSIFKIWNFNKENWIENRYFWYYNFKSKKFFIKNYMYNKNKFKYNFSNKNIFKKISKQVINEIAGETKKLPTQDYAKFFFSNIINYIKFKVQLKIYIHKFFKKKINYQPTVPVIEEGYIFSDHYSYEKKIAAVINIGKAYHKPNARVYEYEMEVFTLNYEYSSIKRSIMFYYYNKQKYNKVKLLQQSHNHLFDFKKINFNYSIHFSIITKIMFHYFYFNKIFKFCDSFNSFKFISFKGNFEHDIIKSYMDNFYTNKEYDLTHNYQNFMDTKNCKDTFFQTTDFTELSEFDQQSYIIKAKKINMVHKHRSQTKIVNNNKINYNKFIQYSNFFYSRNVNIISKVFNVIFYTYFFFLYNFSNKVGVEIINKNNFFKKVISYNAIGHSTISNNINNFTYKFIVNDLAVFEKKNWKKSELKNYRKTFNLFGNFLEFRVFAGPNKKNWLKIIRLNQIFNTMAYSKLIKIKKYILKQSIQIIIKPLRNNSYCTVIPYFFDKNFKKQIFNKSSGDLCKIKGYYRRSIQARRQLYNSAAFALMRFGNKISKYRFSIFRPKMLYETIIVSTNPKKRANYIRTAFNVFFKEQNQKRFPIVSIEPIKPGISFGEFNRPSQVRRRRHKRKVKWLVY